MPGNFSNTVQIYLKRIYPDNLISRGGPVAWPYDSPVFLASSMKSITNETAATLDMELVNRIVKTLVSFCVNFDLVHKSCVIDRSYNKKLLQILNE